MLIYLTVFLFALQFLHQLKQSKAPFQSSSKDYFKIPLPQMGAAPVTPSMRGFGVCPGPSKVPGKLPQHPGLHDLSKGVYSGRV